MYRGDLVFMILAKVKYPYKKEWEKDMGYGQSAPITFETDEIGEYKQYVSATDPKKQWVRELKKGSSVYLEANPNGNGYIVKQKPCNDSEPKPQFDMEQVKFSALVLGECIKEIEAQLTDSKTTFTSEDVRCLAISMFIQLMRSKRTSYEFSLN